MASGSERLKEFEGREYEEDIDLAVRILVNRSVGFRLVQSPVCPPKGIRAVSRSDAQMMGR